MFDAFVYKVISKKVRITIIFLRKIKYTDFFQRKVLGVGYFFIINNNRIIINYIVSSIIVLIMRMRIVRFLDDASSLYRLHVLQAVSDDVALFLDRVVCQVAEAVVAIVISRHHHLLSRAELQDVDVFGKTIV